MKEKLYDISGALGLILFFLSMALGFFTPHIAFAFGALILSAIGMCYSCFNKPIIGWQ